MQLMEKFPWYGLELLAILTSLLTTDANECSFKLLDDRIAVPDSAFVESSFKDKYQGKWARESTNTEMAWCPKSEVGSFKKEYLIIDLGQIHILKMIMTKGLSRHGFITASSYIIEYRRESTESWREYKKDGMQQMIKGSKDHLTEMYQSLEPAIVARWIKIYPYRVEMARICLVLQIYGCKYGGNVLEYTVADGAAHLKLNDANYDGIKKFNMLNNGIGKLTSNIDETTQSDPFINTEQAMGWYRPNQKSNNIDIIFRFDSIRNFSRVILDSYRFLAKDVKIFRKLSIQYSTNGIYFPSETSIHKTINVEPNNNIQKSYKIDVDLEHRIGSFVKLTLTFRSNWIILKNIQFKSTLSSQTEIPIIPNDKGDHTTYTALPPTNIMPSFTDKNIFTKPLTLITVTIIACIVIILLIGIPCVTCVMRKQKKRRKKCKQALQRHYQDEQVRFMGPNYKQDCVRQPIFTLSKTPDYPHVLPPPKTDPSIYTSLGGSDTDSNCTLEPQQTYASKINMMYSTTSSLLPNDFSASFINSITNIYTPYYKQNNLARSQMNLRSHFDSLNPVLNPPDLAHNPNGVLKHNMSFCGPAKVDIRGPLGNSRFHQATPLDDSNMYLYQKYPPIPFNAITNGNFNNNNNNIKMICHDNNVQQKICPNETSNWMTNSIVDLHNLSQVDTVSKTEFGSIYLAVTKPSHKSKREQGLVKVANSGIDNGEDNGQSIDNGVDKQYQCDGLDNFEKGDDMNNWALKKYLMKDSNNEDTDEGVGEEDCFKQSGEMICIRALSRDASDRTRKLFIREINTLLSLKHTNLPSVLKLHNVPLQNSNSNPSSGSVIVVTDYSYMSDVHTFLSTCQLEEWTKSQMEINGCVDLDMEYRIISTADIMHIAIQVANGMEYLHSLNIIHRDLAARNLLLTNDAWHIKISDLAICNPKFEQDYVSFPNVSQISNGNNNCNTNMHRSVTSLMKNIYNQTYQCHGNNDQLSLGENLKLPIRWMAWETLLNGTYMHSSDIYSFGILYWELLTLCRKQPLFELTNDQVIINSNLQAIPDKRCRIPIITQQTLSKVNNFIELCTHFNPVNRPSFRDIILYLEENDNKIAMI